MKQHVIVLIFAILLFKAKFGSGVRMIFCFLPCSLSLGGPWGVNGFSRLMYFLLVFSPGLVGWVASWQFFFFFLWSTQFGNWMKAVTNTAQGTQSGERLQFDRALVRSDGWYGGYQLLSGVIFMRAAWSFSGLETEMRKSALNYYYGSIMGEEK